MRDLVQRVTDGGPADVTCRECGAAAPAADRCPACGRLQPFPPGVDHWQVLGEARRLDLDRGALEARFHALSRRYHPDYFRLRSPEDQAVSLENAAAVNAAYRTLRDPIARMEYLLEREGARGPGPERPPAELFEEILEIQEARQELTGAAEEEASAIRRRLTAAREELAARRVASEAELVRLQPTWDAAPEAARAALLRRMGDLLATRAYLTTVLRDLAAALDDPMVRAGEPRTA